MRLFPFLAPLALVFLLVGSACSGSRQPDVPVRVDSLQAAADPFTRPPATEVEEGRADLAERRQQWAAQDLTDYTFTYTRNCFCPPQYRGPFVVTVRNGAVVEVEYRGEGEAADRALSEYQTVDDLFALVAEAYDRKAASVVTRYDADTGQPREVYIDYDERVADEEVGFDIEPVQPMGG